MKNTLPGFSNDGMYLGDSLARKLPTFLVEGEIDALTIWQEAGDLVNVVATGSTGNGQVAKWEGRLARMPAVFIAFDREYRGDEAAQYWLNSLQGATTVTRYRPLAHDANDMLTQGYDVRQWVEAALSLIDSGKRSQCSQCSHPYTLGTLGTLPPEPRETAPDAAPETFPSYEQFVSTVDRLGTEVFRKCTITLVPKGYTHDMRIAEIEQQERERERMRWAKDRYK